MRIVKTAPLTEDEFGITTTIMPSRQAAYKARNYSKVRRSDNAARKVKRALATPEFIAIDSEGIGRGKNHRAVLLGVGTNQYVAKDLKKGLTPTEVFEYCYSQFKEHPKASFVGFFLSYDFNEWLRYLSIEAARDLFHHKGIAARRIPKDGRNTIFHREFYPVRVPGWEVDMIGYKRLSFRPIVPGCKCGTETGVACPLTATREFDPTSMKTVTTSKDGHAQWMHICDAGPFFQMGFAKVLSPEMWEDEEGGRPCTDAEYELLLKGKTDWRKNSMRVTNNLKKYNALENVLLSRVLDKLAKSLVEVGIHIPKDQWYGPGAAAQIWLKLNNGVRHSLLTHPDKPRINLDLLDVCRKSYVGGWFEIFSHGIIKGTSYNYDINSAYPAATARLPHICDECKYNTGKGEFKLRKGRVGEYVLIHAIVTGSNERIGPVPYRNKQGNILRPKVAEGWYWKHELEAADRAGLVANIISIEWKEFVPCNHPAPYADIAKLYQKRLDVGKGSSFGLAVKLVINSIYGKLAQSTGSAPYNNWFHASLITSYCRTQILDAIATHPGGAEATLMVATDGVYFDSEHPGIYDAMSQYSKANGGKKDKRLGLWDRKELIDLCLFKPGVYWHKDGKDALDSAVKLEVKSRGAPKEAFKQGIEQMEKLFSLISEEECFFGEKIHEWASQNDLNPFNLCDEEGWPRFLVMIEWRLKSCKQAIIEGHWERAAEQMLEIPLVQSSNPSVKRRGATYNHAKQRIDSYVHYLPTESADNPRSPYEMYYYKDSRIEYAETPYVGYDLDGMPAEHEYREALELARDSDIAEDEWINVYGGSK